MAAKTIETRAVISGEDRTGPAFAAVLQHMSKLEDAARRAKVRVGELNADKYLAGGNRVAQLNVERATTRQILSEQRAARREETAHLRETERVQHQIMARQAAIGLAAAAIAHETAHFAHQSLEVYREFDKERRFGKAVMGISDAQQGALVSQAIHMGGSTKYNDIQVLEAQRELAARGLNKDQIVGMMGAAADLGQALDLSLPNAVKQMEGAIFGFKKAIGTTAEAMDSARQTADVQVRAAKISGMTPEDIRELYKYGATPARMSGASEQFLLAFGGISKKANMGGDEAGVAFRALMSAAQSPTRGAKEALLANGLDYSKYQSKIGSISVAPFVRNVAAQYGVALNAHAIGALTRVFSDPAIINDPSKFTPAVTRALGHSLGKKDAKSLKSIAGMANRFRNASGGGADVNGFLLDLMTKLPGNIKLANAIFGAKQGARIANALGDPEVLKGMRQILTEHSEGYAAKISSERMAGFDGAVSRFEGAVKNLESALPRSFDASGKGGVLTNVTDLSGRLIQALAEAPPQLLRLGTEAGMVAGIFAGMKGAEALLGGFGLKGAAIELTEAAHALMGAAGEQKLADAAGGLPGAAKPISRLGRVAKSIPLLATGFIAVEEGLGALQDYKKSNPGLFRGGQKYAAAYGANSPLPSLALSGYPTPSRSRHFVSAPRRGSNGYWVDDAPSLAFAPIGAPSLLPTLAGGSRTARKSEVGVHFDQPPPIRIVVEAGSSLIEIARSAKAAAVQLRAHADTGPGGNGETDTRQ